ncbi:MAG: YqjD family protein [Burkholderiales bacterium]
MATETAVTKDKLAQDLRALVGDAEDLLRVTASQAGEKAAAAREKIQESLRLAKIKLAEAEEIVIDKTKQAARATDEYVHEHPWRAVGIAAGIGLIVGLLIGRR